MRRKTFAVLAGFLVVLFSLVAISGFLDSFVGFSVFDSGSDGLVELKNPVLGLSEDEAIEDFDEAFVLYLLYSIEANSLRNPPFSSNQPKIEIYVGEDVFNSRVEGGIVFVERGEIDGEDVVIVTDRREAVSMIRDRANIERSFREGRSSMELVASKPELLSKGYLKIYSSISGDSA